MTENLKFLNGAFWHPDRPRTPGGWPMYVSPEGHPIAALPRLYAEPLPEGGFEVGAQLMVSPTQASWLHTTKRSLGEVTGILAMYEAAPEAVFDMEFGYVGYQDKLPTAEDVRGILRVEDI